MHHSRFPAGRRPVRKLRVRQPCHLPQTVLRLLFFCRRLCYNSPIEDMDKEDHPMRVLAAMLAAWMLVTLSACAQPQDQPDPQPEPDVQEEPVQPDPPPPSPEELAAAQIEELLSSLTLEEQVGQLFFVRCPADQALEDITTYHLGGYVLFTRDYQDDSGAWLTKEQFVQTLSDYQSAALADTGIPLLIGSDEEGGTVTRASRNPNLFHTLFRSPQKIAAQAGDAGDAWAEEAWEKNSALLALGINVNLSPVADVSTSAQDFIYDRTCGLDAQGTADYVTSVVTAMKDCGIGSVLKHFPGYGNNVDTHTGIAVDQRSLDSFRESDFVPFSAGIAAGDGTTAVLVSHNIMTAVDDTLPASLSPAVHDLLRTELSFDGVAMTDDLAMEAVASYAQDGAVAVLALQAGNDLIITTDYRTQIPQVLQAVEDGTLSPEVIETACRRVLTWKQALGLLE